MIEAIYISDHDDFYIDVDFSDGEFMSFTGEMHELVGRLAHVTVSERLGVNVQDVQAIFPLDDGTCFLGIGDGTSVHLDCDVPTAWNRFASTVIGARA